MGFSTAQVAAIRTAMQSVLESRIAAHGTTAELKLLATLIKPFTPFVVEQDKDKHGDDEKKRNEFNLPMPLRICGPQQTAEDLKAAFTRLRLAEYPEETVAAVCTSPVSHLSRVCASDPDDEENSLFKGSLGTIFLVENISRRTSFLSTRLCDDIENMDVAPFELAALAAFTAVAPKPRKGTTDRTLSALVAVMFSEVITEAQEVSDACVRVAHAACDIENAHLQRCLYAMDLARVKELEKRVDALEALKQAHDITGLASTQHSLLPYDDYDEFAKL